ncbi:MAG: response regulator [Chloroflexi bacterium]|nr:response regulator [Chloroflexota bacterium]
MANILLVEDNTDMRMLLREVLEWGGHQVACGRSGEEGLQTLVSAPAAPDLIISDLMMPGMDGIRFLREVRGNPHWSQVRFVMMSANPHDDRLQTAARHDGLDGVLPKPFSLEDLDAFLS